MVKKLTDSQIIRQMPAAKLRGQLDESQPWWPKRATFDVREDALRLTLRSGVEWVIPRKSIPELRKATSKELVQVELSGEAVRWDFLDVDLSILGIAIDTLGESFFTRASGSIRGRITSRAKAKAARLNGLKGGRPPKAHSSK